MKQEDNCCPSKANSTTKDPNTYIKEELSDNKFKKKIVKTVNELNETQKLVFVLNEDMNKQLKKIQTDD
jgi:hypothetical protein